MSRLADGPFAARPLRLADLLDRGAVTRRLRGRGLSAEAAAGLAARFGAAAEVVQANRADGAAEVTAWFVPGRLEVVGKHTDYAGGRSLTCAVEQGLALVACPGPDARLRLTALDLDASVDVSLGALPPAAPSSWAAYPVAVARRLVSDVRHRPDGTPLQGGDLAFGGTLPAAAGLSSSSALIVATFLGLGAINHLDLHPAFREAVPSREVLAAYLGHVEAGRPFAGFAAGAGVGTRGGSQDHVAILCSRADRLRQYRYAPVACEDEVALPEGLQFVVATSGVAAEKSGGARDRYNRAARLADAAAQAWRHATGDAVPHLGALADRPDVTPDALRQVLSEGGGGFAGSALVERAMQFYIEHTEVVPGVATALRCGDLDALGALVDRSQRGAEAGLRNQVPETVHLARSARALGAVAASAFGAGFGGSVWALVGTASAGAFIEAWRAAYEAAHPAAAQRAIFFPVEPGPAAFPL